MLMITRSAVKSILMKPYGVWSNRANTRNGFCVPFFTVIFIAQSDLSLRSTGTLMASSYIRFYVLEIKTQVKSMPLKIPHSSAFWSCAIKMIQQTIAVINHADIALFIELWTPPDEDCGCRSMDIIILPLYSYGWYKKHFVFCFMASQLFFLFSLSSLFGTSSSVFQAIIVTQSCTYAYVLWHCRVVLREQHGEAENEPFTRHNPNLLIIRAKAPAMPFKSPFIILPRPTQ